MSRIEKQDKKVNKDDNDLVDKLVGINRVQKWLKVVDVLDLLRL